MSFLSKGTKLHIDKTEQFTTTINHNIIVLHCFHEQIQLKYYTNVISI